MSRSNEELVKLIQEGEDVKGNMAQLWQQCRRFVVRLAKKYEGDRAELEDLEQEGYLALYHSAIKYKPAAGASFIHYASYWIRQGMTTYCRGNRAIYLPAHVQESLAKCARFQKEYKTRLGIEPTDRQVCSFMGINQDNLENLKTAAGLGTLASLDSDIPGADDMTLSETVPDTRDQYKDLLEEMNRQQLGGVLWKMVEDLPGKSSDVIRMKYKEELTAKETGDALGMPVEEVQRWQAKGLRELRKPDRSEILARLLEDGEIYNSALHGTGVERFNSTWTSSTERTAIQRLGR